jgi:hypothetical protein
VRSGRVRLQRRRVDAPVLPLTNPASAARCRIQAKIAWCVSRSIRRRVREIVEWSGGASGNSSPRDSRSANESAARHPIARSASRPSNTQSAAVGSSAQAAAPADRRQRRIGGRVPRRTHRNRGCRGSDSTACKRDVRHSAAGLGSPPTSTAASRALSFAHRHRRQCSTPDRSCRSQFAVFGARRSRPIAAHHCGTLQLGRVRTERPFK